MSGRQLDTAVRHIRQLAGLQQARERTDRELLNNFCTHHDQLAFTALVQRHGPMVLSVCRHVLRHTEDAEDAFQATFLVLARKAGSLCKGGALACWLHGVAYRMASQAKRNARRRRAYESRVQTGTAPDPAVEAAWQEVQGVLDAEIQRLPEKYRAPFVLCFLEGHSRAEAARELGVKEGTVWSRLAEARKRLQERLTRRGITLSAVLGALAVSEGARAAAPALLRQATVQAAMRYAAGTTALAAAGSANVAALVEGVSKALVVGKVKLVLAVALAAGVAAGTGLLAQSGGTAAPGTVQQEERRQAAADGSEKPRPESEKRVPTDRFGDPLPPGALNRLGSLRFRHGQGVSQVAYTPDGAAIASTSGVGFVRLWDAKTGKLRWRYQFTDKKASEQALAVSGDGKTLAVLTDFTFVLLATDSGKSLAQHSWEKKAGNDGVRCVAISPDLQMVARGCFDATVRLYDAATGQEKLQISVGDMAKTEIPMAVKFSGNGKTLAVLMNGIPSVGLYDTGSGKLVRTLQTKDGSGFRLELSHNGEMVAMTSLNREDPGRVSLWDVKSGKEKWALDRFAYCTSFSPDDAILAVGSQRNEMVLVDTRSGKDLRRFYTPSQSALGFSRDGKTLAAGQNGGSIALWDVATGKQLPPAPEPSGTIRSLRFVADGKQLLSLADTIDWWDAKSGEVIRRLSPKPEWYWRLAASGDEKLLAVSLLKGGIALIDAQGGQQVRVLSAENSEGFFGAAFSQDGRKLFGAGGFDPRVFVWDVATGKLLQVLASHTGFVNVVAVSPDGRWLASAATPNNARGDYDVRLWDTATGKLVHRLTPQPPPVFRMVFSPDSSHLVSVGGGSQPGGPAEVQLWDVVGGKEIRSFSGHKDLAVSVAISPDGRMLATGGGDKTLRLWEVATGLERRRIAEHQGYVYSLAFSPNGKVLAASSDDAPLYLWDVYGSETAVAAPRKLSKEEGEKLWQQLSAGEADKGFEAICTLVAHPAEATLVCSDGWRVAPRATRRQMEAWLKDLDSEQFAVRQKATAELAKFMVGHEDLLRQARDKAESLETRRRLDQLLGRMPPERLRRLRMVEVLERIGAAPAQRLLQTLATQTEDTELARQAAASVKRLQH